jgi:nucleoside-diphosphate-sugar epimerase
MKTRLPIEDLDHIASSLDDIIPQLSNSRIFITGGTGFFGKWILETIIFLNEQKQINCSAVVLTRNSEQFKKNYPRFDHSSITYIKGDVKDFIFPEGQFQYCIHAASETANLDNTDELEIIHTAYTGTQRILEFAKDKKTRSTLYVSSGAVYGKQPGDLKLIPEQYTGAPDTTQLRSAYGEGKRVAELLCSYYGEKFDLPVKIARCFAFIGPYLPLDSHFACGNFIRNGIKKEPLLIKGDGSTMRSYMYAADLTIYLFKTLIKGDNLIPYNIGSSEEMSIAQLAGKVATHFSPEPEIIISQKKENKNLPERYVPDNKRILTKFSVKKHIDIDTAIKRTVEFYKG